MTYGPIPSNSSVAPSVTTTPRREDAPALPPRMLPSGISLEQEVWLRAWCAAASGPGIEYGLRRLNKAADQCLAEFRERWP